MWRLSLISYSSASTKLCAPIELYLDFYCIEYINWANLRRRYCFTNNRNVFFLIMRGGLTPWLLLMVLPSWNSLCLGTNNSMFRKNLRSCSFGDIFYVPYGHRIQPSIKVAYRSATFHIKDRKKLKNDSSDSLATVKYHFHLIMCFLRYSEEFVAKCGENHNAISLQCTY